ncbi:MAG: hypothetical protein ABR574_01690 [Cryomorphaceae bacterium]
MQKFKTISFLAILIAILAMTSCTTHRKKKCDTCPKWSAAPANPETQSATFRG